MKTRALVLSLVLVLIPLYILAEEPAAPMVCAADVAAGVASVAVEGLFPPLEPVETSWCSAQATCPDGSVVSCEGPGPCQGAPLCYAWCGIYHYHCPGHEYEELCEN